MVTRLFAVLAIGTILGNVALAQLTTLREDEPQLATKVTLHLKIASLSEFTEQLSKATSLSYTVSPAIAERKLTAVFRDRPASEVMGAVEDCLFLHWTKIPGGYRLGLPPQIEHEERDVLEAERSAAQKTIIDLLQAVDEISSIPVDQIQGELKKAQERVNDLSTTSSSNLSRELMVAKRRLYALENAALVPLASAYRNQPERLADTLLAGQTAFASSTSFGALPQLPADAGGFIGANPRTTVGILSMLRYDPVTSCLSGRSCCYQGPNLGNQTTGLVTVRLEQTRDLDHAKLVERLARWSEDADHQVLKATVATDGPVEDSPGYINGGFTLADHLAYVADHTGIPVIADAFRVSCSPGRYLAEKTVGAYLSALKHMQLLPGSLGTGPFGYFTGKKGWLFARHASYWRRLDAEIPESVLKNLEKAYLTKAYPTADDFAVFAGALTAEQVAGVEMGSLTLAARFPRSPLVQAMLPLRLWATLSSGDRTASATDNGLDLTTLSASQAQIVLAEWTQKLWDGHLPGTIWPVLFSPEKFAALRPALGFVETTDLPIPVNTEAATAKPKVPNPEPHIQTRGVHVEFDFRLDGGISYKDIYNLVARSQ